MSSIIPVTRKHTYTVRSDIKVCTYIYVYKHLYNKPHQLPAFKTRTLKKMKLKHYM